MTTLPARRVVLTAALSASLAIAGAFSPRPVSAQSYGQGARVNIYQYMFHPGVLRIPVGATVTWTNYDPFAHTSTSDTGVWVMNPPFSGATTPAFRIDSASVTFSLSALGINGGPIAIGP